MKNSNFFRYVLLFLCMLISSTRKVSPAKVPALFTFGDSIMDPGNNNHLPTTVKANHPPYGLDFEGHIPTGRCSNGKLSADFFASWLELKETLPPFLDPNLSAQDFATGVSFASAGSGYDNLTASIVNVIPMWKQVELFKQYMTRLQDLAGVENSANIISQAIFLVCAGTNDYTENYYFFPFRRVEFSLEQYTDLLLQSSSRFVEDMYELGARKIGVYGIAPPGCLPLEKTLLGMPELEGCMEEFNQVAVFHNMKLQAMIERLKSRLPGMRVVYIDIYNSFLDIVQNPTNYGLETSSRGCCGTGVTEIASTCNPLTPVTCPDPTKYVFWDSVHSTETVYRIMANIIIQDSISKLL